MKNLVVLLVVTFLLSISLNSFAGNGRGDGFKRTSGQAPKKVKKNKKNKKVKKYRPAKSNSFCGSNGCLASQK